MDLRWRESNGVTEPREGRDALDRPGRRGGEEDGPDRAAAIRRGAQRLSRAGRITESAAAWREASRAYLQSLRPVQAIACAIEAAFLDPLPAGAEAEVRDTARAVKGAERVEGQQLLAALPVEARCDLAARLLPSSCGEDEVFSKEDDPAPSLWLIVRGRVRVTRRGTKGARWTVKVAGEGEMLGDWRPLREGEGARTLLAEVPTDLLELRRSDFDEILRRHPETRRIFDGI